MKRTSLLVLIILLWAGAAWAIPPMPYTPTTAASIHVDDILTALGIASEAVNFGAFTGSTIPDNQTAKAAIQALETAVEAKLDKTDAVFTAPTELTIASDAVTITQSTHYVDTAADAASDDLVTISGGAVSGVQVLFLRAAHTDRTVVLKETGNIIIPYGSQLSLDSTSFWVQLVYDTDLSKWVVVGALPDTVDFSAVNLASGTLTLPQGTASAPTTEGQIYHNTSTDVTTIGNGASADQLSKISASETLTNKTITAPYITLPVVDGHAALSLSAAQVSGTIISNAGQALADVNHTLPAAASGYNFIGFVGTALAATNYYRFTAATAATMCLDGTCGKSYVTIDTPTQGATVACYTAQVSSTGLKNEGDLAIGTDTTAVLTAALEFDIAGTGYAKASAETEPGDDVIPQGKYGAVALDIGADGTIDVIEASANATGYDSSALALAGLAAVAASHIRIGTVTVTKSDGDFTFATTALSDANSTVVYTDTAVYTKPYNWICNTGAGTWVTD